MTIDDIAEELSQHEWVGERNVAALFSLSIERYTGTRLDSVNVEQDGDMLLFQWGAYDDGREKHFMVDLTRQVTLDLPDPDDAADSMRQLHLTATYPSSVETGQIGSGEKWCVVPHDAQEFASFIMSSRAYLWAVSNNPSSLDIEIENV